MPFSWKKVKSTRISQLVNDHLHKSQKRRDGSSLVVETGFPTSLIDLFIKNREKLKKPSKKKRKNPPNTPPADANDRMIAGSPLSYPSPLPPPPPSIAGSPSPTHSPLLCPSPLRNPSFFHLPVRRVSEISVTGLSGEDTVAVDEKESGDGRGGDVNTVLLGVLKMFLVVVLALGTKRLTVGITISAFFLLFLEYVWKHVNGLLKPCSEAKGALKLMVQSVWRCKGVKLEANSEVFVRELQQGYLMSPGSASLKSSASRCQDQEIQVVDPKDYMVTRVEETRPENEKMDASCFKGKPGCQEIELMEVVMEKEESICDVVELKKKSRRAKIKSKMKKFVPKKFMGSRKEHDLLENGAASEYARVVSSISGASYREEDRTSEVYACGRLSDVGKGPDTKREEKSHDIEAGVAWRHLVLCVIVLIGLVGGRAFAFVLTVSCFLLLKLGETRPRYMKISMIKSFNNKSG